MLSTTPPTSQKASARPIAFVLQNGGVFSAPVNLVIRPQELTITSPSRSTVHQTLGRDVSGWVDDFGAGLPSAVLSGHTGWRALNGGGPDGHERFLNLRRLFVADFPDAKQSAIESGQDPTDVKLLFVDMLDDLSWSINPGSFVLRRSKSQPLLIQYNISFQALDVEVDYQLPDSPFFGSITGGIGALGAAIATLSSYSGTIQGLVDRANGFLGAGSPIGLTVKGFLATSTMVFNQVNSIVSTTKNGFNSVANDAIAIASDLAMVGVNIMRTVAAISGLPSSLKASLMQVAAAYNEVACIFSNSLRPQQTYEDYDGLYGASNCSSTTGGRPAISITGSPFALIQPTRGVFATTSASLSSVAAIKRSDAVLAPMPMPDVGRNLDNINTGLVLA